MPRERLAEETLELATRIATASSHALAVGKAAFYQQIHLGLAEAYDHTTEVMAANVVAPDGREGIDAFLSKRAPNWRGASLVLAQEGRHVENVRRDVEELRSGFLALARALAARHRGRAALEAGRDHRHAHVLAHGVVHDGAEDDVGVLVGGALHDLGGLVDLEQAEVAGRR